MIIFTLNVSNVDMAIVKLELLRSIAHMCQSIGVTALLTFINPSH